jgi:hypothetical protein
VSIGDLTFDADKDVARFDFPVVHAHRAGQAVNAFEGLALQQQIVLL